MSLVTDITEEEQGKLTEAGWQFVTMSWGQSIWFNPDPDIGQRSATEALELIEADAVNGGRR